MEQMPDAIKRYDPISHITWLEFDGRPSEAVRTALKAHGWRWSGYRVQWYTNQRVPVIPEGLHVEDGGQCDYASERADRLEARASSHNAKGNAADSRASEIASHIPFGQPILVGHHSEGRHRRDLARIERNTETAVGEWQQAQRLNERAEASRKHQERMQSAPVMYRRLERLGVEERDLLRKLAQYQGDTYAYYREQLQTRLDGLRMAMVDLRAAIAEAGGIPADTLTVHVGDIIKCAGFEVLVSRVNPKTYSGVIASGGAKGMTGKWGRSELTRVVSCPHTAPESTEARESAE